MVKGSVYANSGIPGSEIEFKGKVLSLIKKNHNKNKNNLYTVTRYRIYIFLLYNYLFVLFNKIRI